MLNWLFKGKKNKNKTDWLEEFWEQKKEEYPKTVKEVLDDTIVYRKSVHQAIRVFKKLNPWRGNNDQIKSKFGILNSYLANAYNISEPQLVFVKEFVFGPCCFPKSNLIILTPEDDGRYSVVTYLHEFGHILGKNEKETCRWSINLFRLHFPKSYEKLEHNGHVLTRKR